MKLLMVSVICFLIIIGTSRLGYCPGESYGGGGYKDTGSYSGKGEYKGGQNVGNETNKPTQSTTLGQELMDLDAAYKKGIISEEEFGRLKKLIIEQRTKR